MFVAFERTRSWLRKGMACVEGTEFEHVGMMAGMRWVTTVGQCNGHRNREGWSCQQPTLRKRLRGDRRHQGRSWESLSRHGLVRGYSGPRIPWLCCWGNYCNHGHIAKFRWLRQKSVKLSHCEFQVQINLVETFDAIYTFWAAPIKVVLVTQID